MGVWQKGSGWTGSSVLRQITFPELDRYGMLFDDDTPFGQSDEVEGKGCCHVTLSVALGPKIKRHIGATDTGVMDTVSDDLDTAVDVTEENASDPLTVGHECVVQDLPVEQIDPVIVPVTVEV